MSHDGSKTAKQNEKYNINKVGFCVCKKLSCDLGDKYTLRLFIMQQLNFDLRNENT